MRKMIGLILALLIGSGAFSRTAGQKNRFPQPSEEEIKEADRRVELLGMEEVFGQSPSELATFIWDIFKRGRSENFSYYDSNPKTLTLEQSQRPATLLLHSYGSNQGEWLPLLQWIREQDVVTGPIFTLAYPQTSSRENLIQRIQEIKQLYAEAGQLEVHINLVGHSLGGIVSASYAYDPDSWVKGIHVQKVVSISGRLKNIEPPRKTPLYGYCYMLLPLIDSLWQRIEENRGSKTRLYAIAAAEDWLVPPESVLVGSLDGENAVIPNAGHALIARKQGATEKVIHWLFQEK